MSRLLPICSWCKKVRDEQGGWVEIKGSTQMQSGNQFSHGICPSCALAQSHDIEKRLWTLRGNALAAPRKTAAAATMHGK